MPGKECYKISITAEFPRKNPRITDCYLYKSYLEAEFLELLCSKINFLFHVELSITFDNEIVLCPEGTLPLDDNGFARMEFEEFFPGETETDVWSHDSPMDVPLATDGFYTLEYHCASTDFF